MQDTQTASKVRRMNVNEDMIRLYFRSDDALEAAIAQLPAVLANHPRTLINRTSEMPQLWLPILPTLH